jgi:putative DNA primase/helicase
MTLDELAAKFRGPAKRAGHRLMVFCSSHEDTSRQSLALSQSADGKLLAHCYAGCATETILAAVGLRITDLFPDRATGNGHAHPRTRELVATYDYTDGAGELIFQVCRFQPKEFVQRRPDGHGGWIWNLQGIRRPLYRLPDLVEQARVYFTEGEKDADRLAALGLPATTAAGGANAWRPDYAEQLVVLGIRELVVLPDNDDPGRAYAQAVARAAHEHGLEVRVLSLPGLGPKQDISDWLDAGNTLAQLEAVVAAAAHWTGAPEPTISAPMLGIGAGTFLTRSFPDLESLVEGVLSSEGSGFIGGEEKLGKSYYATEETLCLGLALPVCGRFAVTTPRRVLFIEEEDGPRRVHSRLRALLRGHGLDPDDAALQRQLDDQILLAVWEGISLDDAAALDRLDATITRFQPAVVYLDVLRKLTLKDLNKADQAGKILAALDDLRRRYGVIFRVLHHFRKVQGFRTGRGSQELGGSFVLGAWAEQSMFFEPIGRKRDQARVEVQTKDGTPIPAFRLTFETEGPRHAPTLVRLKAEDDPDRQDADDLVFQAVATLDKTPALAGKPGVSRATITAALKRSEPTVRRALKRLEDAGRVLVIGQATKNAPLYGVNE